MEEQESILKNEPVAVNIQPNGPIAIKGRFSFRESSGKIIEGEQELFLCRCGNSSSKPWCDGTHKITGSPR